MVQSSNFSWESVEEAESDKKACKDSHSWMPAARQKGPKLKPCLEKAQDADGQPPLPCFMQLTKIDPVMQQMWTVNTTPKKKVVVSCVEQQS